MWIQDAEGLHKLPAIPAARTYRGYLAGQINSTVTASIHDGQVDAVVRTGQGQMWVVKPGSRVLGSSIDRTKHIVYQSTDIVPSGGTCGVEDSPIEVPEIPPPPGVQIRPGPFRCPGSHGRSGATVGRYHGAACSRPLLRGRILLVACVSGRDGGRMRPELAGFEGSTPPGAVQGPGLRRRNTRYSVPNRLLSDGCE